MGSPLFLTPFEMSQLFLALPRITLFGLIFNQISIKSCRAMGPLCAILVLWIYTLPSSFGAFSNKSPIVVFDPKISTHQVYNQHLPPADQPPSESSNRPVLRTPRKSAQNSPQTIEPEPTILHYQQEYESLKLPLNSQGTNGGPAQRVPSLQNIPKHSEKNYSKISEVEYDHRPNPGNLVDNQHFNNHDQNPPKFVPNHGNKHQRNSLVTNRDESNPDNLVDRQYFTDYSPNSPQGQGPISENEYEIQPMVANQPNRKYLVEGQSSNYGPNSPKQQEPISEDGYQTHSLITNHRQRSPRKLVTKNRSNSVVISSRAQKPISEDRYEKVPSVTDHEPNSYDSGNQQYATNYSPKSSQKALPIPENRYEKIPLVTDHESTLNHSAGQEYLTRYVPNRPKTQTSTLENRYEGTPSITDHDPNPYYSIDQQYITNYVPNSQKPLELSRNNPVPAREPIYQTGYEIIRSVDPHVRRANPINGARIKSTGANIYNNEFRRDESNPDFGVTSERRILRKSHHMSKPEVRPESYGIGYENEELRGKYVKGVAQGGVRREDDGGEEIADAAGSESKGEAKEHSKMHEEGAGEEGHAEHHEEGGEEEKKGYESHHEHEKGEKGHHDKEEHDKHYDEEEGDEKKHSDDSSYYQNYDSGEKKEKTSEFAESGKFSKGHSTKGNHEVHKKDEYEKIEEFFDESHDEDGHEKDEAYHHKFEEEHGGSEKSGHYDAADDEEKHGKKGEYEKGHHYKEEKGHDVKEGDEKHHEEASKYGKKSGHEDGKKWEYKE